MTTLTGAELKLARAKTQLILNHPFYATLVCNMPWVEDNSIPTMATDGGTVYWNRAFVDNMSVEETVFVKCHEIMHVVFQHIGRLNGRNMEKWNVATDYVINDLLVRERIGVMPKMGLMDAALVRECNYLADRVYEKLPDNPNQPQAGSGKPGAALDGLMKPTGSPAEQAERENIMKIRVAQAAQAAKMQGKLSADLERLVGSILKPIVPWEDVLRRFVSVRAKINSSYARPKRRFLGEDLYLPSLSGEQMGPLTIAVDCSGSIGQRELDRFATEIYAIVADVRPSRLDVVYFDSEVSHHDTYQQGEDIRIVGHGGGGTAFSPIFAHIDRAGVEPVACVVLTDLCCSDFGPAPDYPVLWVTTHDTKAPWGEVIEMK